MLHKVLEYIYNIIHIDINVHIIAIIEAWFVIFSWTNKVKYVATIVYP
jgi:hypothetical protein